MTTDGKNTHPSMKTAASASLYVMKPVPWKPTTEYANWKTASELSRQCTSDGKTYISVEAQTRSQSNRKVRQETHEEGREGGDGGGGGDEVEADGFDAGEVGVVGHAAIMCGTLASASGIRQNCGIHGDLYSQ